ncbi:MAG: hypothetical protein IT365_01335 [Candidatus Hydrogenedentes bacterium]|nr:hypothetical protein [Candidatus Hydrogenedentota bacterium]
MDKRSEDEPEYRPCSRHRLPRLFRGAVLICLALLSAGIGETATALGAEAGPPEKPSTTESVQAGAARVRSVKEHARAVQEYEAIGLIADCVFGSPFFEIPVEAVNSGVLAGPAPAPASTCAEFVLEYPPHEGIAAPPGIAGTLRGVFGVHNGVIRGECISRKPNWRARGLAYEPIGLTIAVTSTGLKIYQPHRWTAPQAAREAVEAAVATVSESPIRVGQDNRVVATVANSWVQHNCRVLPLKEPREDTANRTLVATWEEDNPWFYLARLKRVEYDTSEEGGRSSVRSGRVYGDATSDPIASVRWEQQPPESGGTPGGRRVILDVHEKALAYSHGSDTLPIAPPRRIVWTYNGGTGETRLPSCPVEVYIETADGNRVMSFHTAPTGTVTFDARAGDPRDLLEGPLDDCRWVYYSILRRFFDVRRPSNDESAIAVREFIEPCRNLIDMAISTNDVDTEIASRRLLQEIWFAAGDREQWYAAWNEFIETAQGVYDCDQLSMEYGWMSGYLIRYKRIDDLNELVQRFAKALVLHQNPDRLIQNGKFYASGSGHVQAAAAFDAVLLMSSDSLQRQEALLGKAEALAALAIDLARQGVAPVELQSFEDQAVETLAAFDSTPNTQIPSEDIERCRSAVARASQIVADAKTAPSAELNAE